MPVVAWLAGRPPGSVLGVLGFVLFVPMSLLLFFVIFTAAVLTGQGIAAAFTDGAGNPPVHGADFDTLVTLYAVVAGTMAALLMRMPSGETHK